jgi:hypothetical protein
MKTRARIISFSSLAFLALTARASIIIEPTRTFDFTQSIPDFQDPPLVFEQTISDSAILSLTGVQIGLRLVGISEGSGFASEMFVSISRNFGPSAILLNRVGISPADPVGAFYDGWNVTFSDTAPNGDIHSASLPAGILQGSWAPDGRVDPTSGVRSQLLSVLHGTPGNGVWRLAVADLDFGGQMQIESWSLTLTGDTVVPEIAFPPFLFLALLLVHPAIRNRLKTTPRRTP